MEDRNTIVHISRGGGSGRGEGGDWERGGSGRGEGEDT